MQNNALTLFCILTGIAVIHGEQKESESDMVDGRYSPPPAVSASRTMDVGLDIMPGNLIIKYAV